MCSKCSTGSKVGAVVFVCGLCAAQLGGEQSVGDHPDTGAEWSYSVPASGQAVYADAGGSNTRYDRFAADTVIIRDGVNLT